MIKLYHGSNVAIDQVDLSKSRPFKDFGRAFYLSANEQQAWERAYAAVFIFANRNRRKPAFSHDYDIVYGPIANDNVGEQVVLFKGGYITKERFLRKLKNMKGITFQYAFCTEAAIAKLKKL